MIISLFVKFFFGFQKIVKNFWEAKKNEPNKQRTLTGRRQTDGHDNVMMTHQAGKKIEVKVRR